VGAKVRGIRDGHKMIRKSRIPVRFAEIDLLFELPISYTDLKKRSVSFDLGGVKIPTIAIQDLIEIKIQAARKQDLSDVEHLKMILER